MWPPRSGRLHAQVPAVAREGHGPQAREPEPLQLREVGVLGRQLVLREVDLLSRNGSQRFDFQAKLLAQGSAIEMLQRRQLVFAFKGEGDSEILRRQLTSRLLSTGASVSTLSASHAIPTSRPSREVSWLLETTKDLKPQEQQAFKCF